LVVVVVAGSAVVVVVDLTVVVVESGVVLDVVVEPFGSVVVVDPERTVLPVPLVMSPTRPDTSDGRS